VLFFLSLVATACTTLPPSPPGSMEAALGEAALLLQERRPRSALARLDAVPEPADPALLANLLGWRVRAAFAAEAYAQAGAACDRLATVAAEAPGWRPTCWEVELEAAEERGVASGQVALEIEALLARDPDDFGHLQAAFSGHLARRDRDARLPLLERLAELAATPGQRAWVAGNLAEEAFGVRDAATRRELARRLLALVPDHRLAGSVVAWVLGEGKPVDLDAARDMLDLEEGPPPSWRIALALAEWGLEQAGLVPPEPIAELLDVAEAGASPATLVPEPMQLDAASRDWLWARVATRLVVARARTLDRLGAPRGALALLETAPPTDPPSAEVAYLRGRLLDGLGEPLAARALYREALVLAPHARAEAHLAALLAQAGEAGAPRDRYREREGGPAFDDVTDSAGLSGVAAQRVAWGDPDGDGDPDLLLDGRLFVNDGGGRFTESALPEGSPATGGLWADVDGDGVDDLLLTGQANRVLFNRGEAGWETRTLPGGTGQRTEAAAFADVDRDGDLDLYLANYERGGTRRGLCHPDQLLLNDGAGGFSDITQFAGIVTEQPLCGRGMAWADVDADGWPDAVVGNYRLGPNLLWRNLGDGRFEEVGAAWGVRGDNSGGAFGHTIAVAPGDLDGDGHEDLVLTNLAHPRFIEFSDRTRILLTAAGSPPPYVDRRVEVGLRFEETESDAALGDVDNDGDLDLFVTAIYPGRWSRLYLNDGRGRLKDVSWLAGARVANAWGAAFADIDADGALDLLVASSDGVRLLRNRGGGGHWLAVRVDDPACNHAGVGTVVTLRAAGREQRRHVRIGRGTGSQDDVTLHFGLGRHDGPLDIEAVNLCQQRFAARVPYTDRRVTLHGPR
jgi:tetratricopeptide (TPR) repeat protein